MYNLTIACANTRKSISPRQRTLAIPQLGSLRHVCTPHDLSLCLRLPSFRADDTRLPSAQILIIADAPALRMELDSRPQASRSARLDLLLEMNPPEKRRAGDDHAFSSTGPANGDTKSYPRKRVALAVCGSRQILGPRVTDCSPV